MTILPLDRLGLGWRSHLSALWWLGLLYRRPNKFQNALEAVGWMRGVTQGIVLLLHIVPYTLGTIVLIETTTPGNRDKYLFNSYIIYRALEKMSDYEFLSVLSVASVGIIGFLHAPHVFFIAGIGTIIAYVNLKAYAPSLGWLAWAVIILFPNVYAEYRSSVYRIIISIISIFLFVPFMVIPSIYILFLIDHALNFTSDIKLIMVLFVLLVSTSIFLSTVSSGSRVARVMSISSGSILWLISASFLERLTRNGSAITV